MKKYYVLIMVLIMFTSSQGDIQTDQMELVIVENAHSIIVMIGDGMGINQMYAGGIVEYGDYSETVFAKLTNNNISTANIDDEITDSAASATTIASGVRTSNGRIGQDVDGNDVQTILEDYEDAGYKTGLVTTVTMNHATPAAFAASEPTRYNYGPIASDMARSGTDLLFGGGSSDTVFGGEIDYLKSLNYTYIQTRDELFNGNELPIIGLFSSNAFPEERTRTDGSTIPTLSELTTKSLGMLNQENNPFFLMIEGGQIDWAGHDNDMDYLIHEQIQFEKSVQVAKDFVDEHPDVTLLVLADHETGGLQNLQIPNTFTDDIPLESDTLAEKIGKRSSRASELTYDWTLTYHSAQEIYFGYHGYRASEFSDVNHTSGLYTHMKAILDDTIQNLTTKTITINTNTTSTITSTATSLSTTIPSSPSSSTSDTLLPLSTIFTLVPITLIMRRKTSK